MYGDIFLLSLARKLCFEIVPDNPFGVVILFYPLSSAKLPKFICLTSLLHTTFVRFRKFSTILWIFGANKNGWRQSQNFGRPLCPFCIRFVFIGQWDRAFIVARCYCFNLYVTDDSRAFTTMLILPVQMSWVGFGRPSDTFSSSSLTLTHLFLIPLLQQSNRSLWIYQQQLSGLSW